MHQLCFVPKIYSDKTIEMPIVTIGYYPLRGKAQVPRLLLEYFCVPYEDKLFELD